MSEDAVAVTVEGYSVSDAMFDDDEIEDVAHDIASDIGGRLSSLGTSCGHGRVVVTIDGRAGASDD